MFLEVEGKQRTNTTLRLMLLWLLFTLWYYGYVDYNLFNLKKKFWKAKPKNNIKQKCIKTL